jgi:hypothetical protein
MSFQGYFSQSTDRDFLFACSSELPPDGFLNPSGRFTKALKWFETFEANLQACLLKYPPNVTDGMNIPSGVCNKNIQLQVNVENLFDKAYYASAHSNTNITPGSPIAANAVIGVKF